MEDSPTAHQPANNALTELARFGDGFDNPGMDKPKPRRWFRFSLRTMFVLVTVVCVWLGYQLNWIRERREVLSSGEVAVLHRLNSEGGAPRSLWLFGERGYSILACSKNVDKEAIERLFPESTIYFFE